MQSEAMKQEEIEALAREMAKGIKTEADFQYYVDISNRASAPTSQVDAQTN